MHILIMTDRYNDYKANPFFFLFFFKYTVLNEDIPSSSMMDIDASARSKVMSGSVLVRKRIPSKVSVVSTKESSTIEIRTTMV